MVVDQRSLRLQRREEMIEDARFLRVRLPTLVLVQLEPAYTWQEGVGALIPGRGGGLELGVFEKLVVAQVGQLEEAKKVFQSIVFEYRLGERLFFALVIEQSEKHMDKPHYEQVGKFVRLVFVGNERFFEFLRVDVVVCAQALVFRATRQRRVRAVAFVESFIY